MKIIKYGDKLNTTHVVECKRCGCVFSFTEREVIKNLNKKYGCCTDVICPQCGHTVVVKSGNWGSSQ